MPEQWQIALAERQREIQFARDAEIEALGGNVVKTLDDKIAALSEERRNDIKLSTLEGYVKALGGSLKLVASFPDKEDIQLQSST